jgi:hypothetical protein
MRHFSPTDDQVETIKAALACYRHRSADEAATRQHGQDLGIALDPSANAQHIDRLNDQVGRCNELVELLAVS